MVGHIFGSREDPSQGGLGSRFLDGHGVRASSLEENGDNQAQTDLPWGHSGIGTVGL